MSSTPSNVKKITPKRLILLGIRNILLIFLVLTPVVLYLGTSLGRQYMAPTDKQPWIHWNGLDPANKVYVSWETAINSTSYVRYGVNNQSLDGIAQDSTSVGMHHIVLSSLTADTRYYYRVGSADNQWFSEIRSFKTAPIGNSNFSFSMISDTQQMWGTGHYATITKAMASLTNNAFIAYAGDMAQERFDQPTLNYFWKVTSMFTANTPVVPNPGNHDTEGYDEDIRDGGLYAKYWGVSTLPNHHYYSFNWSNTQFVMAEVADTGDVTLDLTAQDNKTALYNTAHDAWLNQTLAAGQDKDYRILVFHRALYSSNGDGDEPELAARFMPIITKYNVSLVFYGHEHIYERFLVQNHTLVCLASGGSMQNAYVEQIPETQVMRMGASFTQISVDPIGITIKTYTPTLSVIDNVRLIKVGSQLLPESEVN